MVEKLDEFVEEPKQLKNFWNKVGLMDEHMVLVKMPQPQEQSRYVSIDEINCQHQTVPSNV